MPLEASRLLPGHELMLQGHALLRVIASKTQVPQPNHQGANGQRPAAVAAGRQAATRLAKDLPLSVSTGRPAHKASLVVV